MAKRTGYLNFLCVAFLLLQQYSLLYSQTDSSSESFFPAAIGNIWNYSGGGDTTHTSQTKLERDSIAGGERYLFYDTSHAPLYKIDSALNVSYFANGWLQYKLTAKKGDVWTAIGGSGGRIAARVDSIYWGVVLDKLTQIMVIGYYRQALDTTFFFGLLYTDYLAAGFGLILQIGDASQTPNVELVGCVIDGITYGTVMDVNNTSDKFITSNFKLFPAFPNPFNPATTIVYSLPRNSNVQISVYTILGVKVADLIDHFATAGEYSLPFEPSNLPSGVYFIRMTANEFVQTTKIIYAK